MPQEHVKEYFDSPASWNTASLKYQVQMQQDIVRLIPPDARTILDAGCGNGLITNILPDHLQVTGLDRSATALADVKWPTEIGDVTNLPFPDRSFDLVMCNDVIEHLDDDDRRQAVSELVRVTDRYLIISVPFRENLVQSMLRCANCGLRYHANHHLSTFGLKTVPNLLADFPLGCVRQVISGDCWQRDPPAIIALRRYLGLQNSPADNPVCLSCGESRIEQEQGSEQLNGFLDWAAAGLTMLQPALLDYSLTRTECISLFDRQHQSTTDTAKSDHWQVVDESGSPVTLNEVNWPVDRIDFSNADLFMRPWLPRAAGLPYAVSSEETGTPQLLTEGASLLCGFFDKPEQPDAPAELEVAGYAAAPAQIDISQFDEIKSYGQIKRIRVDGDFRVIVPCTPTLSRYGFLFKLEGFSGVSELRTVRLQRGKAPSARFLRNSDASAQFLVQNGSPDLAISLSVYGTAFDVDSVFNAATTLTDFQDDKILTDDPAAMQKYLETCLDEVTSLEAWSHHKSHFRNAMTSLRSACRAMTQNSLTK